MARHKSRLFTGKRRIPGVRVRWFLLAALIFILFCSIFTHFLFIIWENYWVQQRQAEALRYCNFITTEIPLKEREESGAVDFLNSELQSVNRMYGYIRVLILDDRGIVVMDSSESRVGRVLLNREVLTAMSGQNVTGGDRGAFRIAMPIYESEGEQVQGVLYAFVNTGSLRLNIRQGESRILILEVGLGIAVILGYLLLTVRMTRPFPVIIRWLKQFKTSDPEETKPVFPVQDEYQEIVDSVQDATRDLQRLDRSRKEFVSNVSHELKTPLSSIKVLSESLLLQDSVPEEMYKEFLTDINSEVDRMNSIVSDLLTLVRLEEGENALTVSKFLLNDMVEDIVKRLRPLADPRHVILRTEGTDAVEVEADETKLTLAISNLVQNAIKYNRENGFVTVRVGQKEDKAVVEVIDTGIGIEEEHFTKLFERFYRVEKSRERSAGGTGLGLSIVKQIVQLHHGTIEVKSTIGEGTTFTMALPLDQVQDTEDEV